VSVDTVAFSFNPQLCDAMGPEITQAELIPAFVRLLRDTEAEVRTAAAFKVTGVAKKLPADVSIKHLLPCVKELVTDSSQHARGTLHKPTAT
jgi:serine/threonine-protein phosphatase 2A regulatory subunit A